MGLRPEHLCLADAPGDGAMDGRLVFKENLGADTYVHIAVADGAHRVVLRIDTATAANLALGARVWVAQAGGEALAFDAAGRRLRFVDAPARHSEAVA